MKHDIHSLYHKNSIYHPPEFRPRNESQTNNQTLIKQNEKILIIFDVDKTITNEDSLDVISKYLLTSEQKLQFQQNSNE